MTPIERMDDAALDAEKDRLLAAVDKEALCGQLNSITGAYPSQRRLEAVQRERMRRALAIMGIVD